MPIPIQMAQEMPNLYLRKNNRQDKTDVAQINKKPQKDLTATLDAKAVASKADIELKRRKLPDCYMSTKEVLERFEDAKERINEIRQTASRAQMFAFPMKSRAKIFHKRADGIFEELSNKMEAAKLNDYSPEFDKLGSPTKVFSLNKGKDNIPDTITLTEYSFGVLKDKITYCPQYGLFSFTRYNGDKIEDMSFAPNGELLTYAIGAKKGTNELLYEIYGYSGADSELLSYQLNGTAPYAMKEGMNERYIFASDGKLQTYIQEEKSFLSGEKGKIRNEFGFLDGALDVAKIGIRKNPDFIEEYYQDFGKDGCEYFRGISNAFGINFEAPYLEKYQPDSKIAEMFSFSAPFGTNIPKEYVKGLNNQEGIGSKKFRYIFKTSK